MRLISGLSDDWWHRLTESAAYEWWYFDAISDDGETAFVFIFFASLPFSPDALTDHEAGRGSDPLDHVALATSLYRGGKQIGYALNRYDRAAFRAATDALDVRIGPNAVAHARGRIELRVDTPILFGGTHLKEKLLFEPRLEAASADLGRAGGDDDHVWNPAAPDCAVTGSLELAGAGGATVWSGPFSGRGYHDHNYGRRPLTEGIRRWHWGRVHIGDSTLVYYHTEPEVGGAESVLAALAPGREPLVSSEGRFSASAWRRRILCPRFPSRVEASAEAGGETIRLTGVVRTVVDWGPFYMRFLTDFEVERGGRRETGLGISEYLDPKGLRRRIYRPLIKTRIRRVAASL